MPLKKNGKIIKAGGLLELRGGGKQSDIMGFRRTSRADAEPRRKADESRLLR